MGRLHVLTSRDTVKRRGTCEHCGPDIPIRPRKTPAGVTTWVCRRPKEPRGTEESRQRRQRMMKYGLTREQHDKLLAERSQGCRICGSTEKALHVDHCHSTGRVRGWLCRGCNHGLGNFGDDPELLRRAAVYLEG